MGIKNIIGELQINGVPVATVDDIPSGGGAVLVDVSAMIADEDIDLFKELTRRASLGEIVLAARLLSFTTNVTLVEYDESKNLYGWYIITYGSDDKNTYADTYVLTLSNNQLNLKSERFPLSEISTNDLVTAIAEFSPKIVRAY